MTQCQHCKPKQNKYCKNHDGGQPDAGAKYGGVISRRRHEQNKKTKETKPGIEADAISLEIIDFLKKKGPLKSKTIAEGLNKSYHVILYRLNAMAYSNIVKKSKNIRDGRHNYYDLIHNESGEVNYPTTPIWICNECEKTFEYYDYSSLDHTMITGHTNLYLLVDRAYYTTYCKICLVEIAYTNDKCNHDFLCINCYSEEMKK